MYSSPHWPERGSFIYLLCWLHLGNLGPSAVLKSWGANPVSVSTEIKGTEVTYRLCTPSTGWCTNTFTAVEFGNTGVRVSRGSTLCCCIIEGKKQSSYQGKHTPAAKYQPHSCMNYGHNKKKERSGRQTSSAKGCFLMVKRDDIGKSLKLWGKRRLVKIKTA